MFDHIAECMAHFMKEHGVYREQLPLGFTFSFPCKQEGLTRARLVQWTKGFRCSGVESQDVVQLLREAVARRGVCLTTLISRIKSRTYLDIQITVCALINDTTGCLMSCAWKSRSCYVGVIIGTGTNACYMEELDNVELVQDLPEVNEEGPSQMVVNTEWGAFGDNGELEFIRTEYDHEIDRNSINKGRQLYEKMISGMYMGELARLALVRLVKMNLIFEGQGSEQLFERGSFATKYISEIEDDKPGEYHNCMQVLEELALDATEEDCASVRYVCECVSRRAAYLVSAGIATLLNKMKRPKVTVAVDGSVYRFHPHFHDLMTAKISQLLKPGIKFELMLSEDGSGRGAALVAAVACRIALQQAEQQSSASS
ncbi:unnamed protein product [Darwinula stevensoni]|uniref:Phosphotransferase n=1 Tax=Darwinula stevensoni TaxID=69355 RepID=A0A7R9AAK9_9CRUS|nr:unnamed protein product [Darwinula stevensoni]CAG0898463.1 unnamed protein product [Darwinula stevensoni]